MSAMMLRPEPEDFPLYPDPAMFAYNGLSSGVPMGAHPYAFPEDPAAYAGAPPSFPLDPIFAGAASTVALASPDLHSAKSNYSTASAPSAASSTLGSPHSVNAQAAPVSEWSPVGGGAGLAMHPGIVQYDDSFGPANHEYSFRPGMDDFALDLNSTKSSFVDPSILHPQFSLHPDPLPPTAEAPIFQAHMYPVSPALSPVSSRSPHPHHGSQSPFLDSTFGQYPYPPPMHRRSSVAISHHSFNSQDGNLSSEESREKGRCTWPDCGKVFKDLKAHMLTHQTERPEKCPIQTCDYHVKGFARKYDKNRHTLTHYKGTMVCGFCPGSGSAAEKSFNRADVFKRHLTSVHAVEQTPPNSRKKSTASTGPKKLAGYAPDATGKCSTCSATFSSAQDFYEHLDDCVLRIVQQEEPSEAINAARLAEVEQDTEVFDTLNNHSLPTTTVTHSTPEEEDEDDEPEDDDLEDDFNLTARARKGRPNRNPINGVQKSRGMTHSKGGVTLNTKGRKKRKDYPSSWGCQPAQMKMKKRVLTVFDGPRRLWKDDMMLDTDYEVRMKLTDEKAYVTDLDVQTMRRASAFHDATEDEKGPWISDDLTRDEIEALMKVESNM